jgi:predicted kinase
VAVGVEPLVVWINGAFGVGKTSVAEELVPLLPGSLLFDPELIGVMLRAVIPAKERTDDFQDIPAWRELTRDAVVALARTRQPGVIVVPMTLVHERYFEEVVGGVRARGVRIVHVTLEASADVIAERLRTRSGNEGWGLARVPGCVGALRDERFAGHLDASSAEPRELAGEIAMLVGESAVRAQL